MPGTDFEQLEDLGADPIAAARIAHARSQGLSGTIAVALRRELADLARIAENRSALTAEARAILHGLARALKARVDAEASASIGPVLEAIIASLAGSERVADLLAAERYIGRCRGIV